LNTSINVSVHLIKSFFDNSLNSKVNSPYR
jgi:hypothetical protein